jgi:glutamate racemase
MTSSTTFPGPILADARIGVFDSGIGGLSVLRHIQARLPRESLLYFADSGFAPYGEKTEDFIVRRSLAIADFLLQHGAKALVVACNTATAAAIRALRERYPALALVGVEPGLKPAAILSKSRIIGVLATDRTINSTKFNLLREQISAATGVRFLSQACIGLANQIEEGELSSPTTTTLVQRYVAPLIEQGADTLVLGCTHYPFVQALIETCVCQATPQAIAIIDTGEPVARQLARLLSERNLLTANVEEGTLQAFTTGSETTLRSAFSTLLKLHPSITCITAQHPAQNAH